MCRGRTLLQNTLFSPTAKLYRYNFTPAQHRQSAAATAASEHNVALLL